MSGALRILVIGASYGALIAARVALAGHRVTLVGHQQELDAMHRHGALIDMPFRDPPQRHVLRFTASEGICPGTADWGLSSPADARPEDHDLAFLVVQEPQAAAPALLELFERIAAARLPLVSLMNLAPLSYLKRIGAFDDVDFHGVHAATEAWRILDGVPQTLASPDAQAVRPDPAQPQNLRVTLPTNFKCAPFDDAAAQHLLLRLARDIDASRIDLGGRQVSVPVRLVPTESIYTPFAKVPMLITGNFRSVERDRIIPICDAVWGDPARSREIYDWVRDLIVSRGAAPEVFVPFDRYAEAARSLTLPSSAARALAAGAMRIERADLFVRALAGVDTPLHDDLAVIIDIVEDRLRRNRA
jgi:hypothetical protein